MSKPDRPRFVPAASLPPYAFVPGRFPHPMRDPAGHSYGHHAAPVAPLDPDRWSDAHDYLLGVDLFNHGYYWEAHEAWEGLWHAAKRQGPVAELLQGLIKLAASGVKVREGRASGTRALAEGARVLFLSAQEHLGGPSAFLGLDFADLFTYTHQAEPFATDTPDTDPGVRIVFPFVLHPRAETDR